MKTCTVPYAEKDKPLNANAPAVSGRTVEITDEDETIVIAFIPVTGSRRSEVQPRTPRAIILPSHQKAL